MNLYYLSHPYTGYPPFAFIKRCYHIYKAWRLTAKLWQKGYLIISPVLLTANFELLTNLSYNSFISRDLELLKKCDVLIMSPGWRKSKGCKIEYKLAKKLKKKIIDLTKEEI